MQAKFTKVVAENPDPSVTISMRVFGDPLFRDNYARLGRWVHMWNHAVWKADPRYFPIHADDESEDTIYIATMMNWLVEEADGLWLTGPNKEPRWLRCRPKSPGRWRTYIVEAVGQGIVKIGKSRDIEKRVSALQTSNPHRLRLLKVFDADIESELHERFAVFRRAGEWFSFADPIKALLSERTTDGL